MSLSIQLTLAERKFLLNLAYNGGEIDLDHDFFKDENPSTTIKALDKLVRNGSVNRIRIIGTSNKFSYRLTDIGTNLVNMIVEREKANNV